VCLDYIRDVLVHIYSSHTMLIECDYNACVLIYVMF